MEDPYYLVNFQCVLEDVRSRCGDLLLPEERARLEAFRSLPGDARRLYVRMLTRKGPWFRPGALAYPEIGPGALEALAAAGFLAGPEEATAAELAGLLRKPELEALLEAAGIPFRRAEGREALASRVPEALLRDAADAVAPRGRDWARLLFLLFFGNLEQDLTDFVLAELGHVRYEAYEVDPACRAFGSRQEVDRLLSLDGLRTALEAGEDLEGITGSLLAMEHCPGLRVQRRYHRLLGDVGREWERRGSPEEALACLRRCALPPARERMARIHHARGESALAAETALAMAEAPLDVGEERFARRFLARLARHDPRAALWAETHPPDPPLPEVRLRVPRHPSGSVEQAALEASGWEGFWTENALWTALYGLAFWDVIFAPVPGAFQHRFQLGPADLRTPGFAQARRGAIAARLAELEAPGAPRRLILARAAEKRGVANAFVNWKALAPGHLEAALDTLPQAALLAFLRAMAPNPAAFRSGFPDLFLHRDGRCMLWEVKGPGDALRPEQERWLALFNRAGLDARVAWVSYLEEGAPSSPGGSP
ncbi:VRR-NUC domain-containing protein [Mesoterricola silvestris]|uniref:phosphodiesterase I n=1 Tax=Mesoterricola silvestris TaxID=2927979 RepID=A0AA48KAN6_9BACT|nr:VRR-NUC domain-containing protein [Mesoterricola silvestris]BDU74285.1 nuclease [Mesoterricola silvestris]